MMRFRTIKTAIEDLLVAAAAGRYQVQGYQNQGLAAEEILDDNRLVQVIYDQGTFPKSSSGKGPFTHDQIFKIILTVSKKAEGDLSALEDDFATPAEKATALAASRPAAKLADDSLDELFDHVFQELMKGDNIDFGITSFKVANRWLNDFKKSDPVLVGDMAVLSGTVELSCRIDESVVSTTETPLDTIDMTLKIKDDINDPKAGVVEVY